MKIKIEVKSFMTGSVLFEYETENNTIKKTLEEARLRGADLRGAYLRGAEKIKTANVMTGLYTYVVIPYITEKGVIRIKMGCYDRTLKEWDDDFWNNPSEFPNDNSLKSKSRLFAFETAKSWLTLISETL